MKKVLITGWAGFDNGEIDLDPFAYNRIYGVIYKTRKEARDRYKDVRRVEIREVKRQQSKPRTRRK